MNKKEIEKKLKMLPHRLCVAFAARAAMRVLPILADFPKGKEDFWYWAAEERTKHIASIWTGSLTAAASVSSSSSAYAASVSSSSSAYASSSAVSSTSAYASVSSVSSTSACAAASSVVSSYASASATYASFAASTSDTAGNPEMSSQLQNEELTGLFPTMDPRAYLETPLWGEVPQEVWEGNWKRFKSALLKQDRNFQVLVNWYQDRLDGKPIDWDLLEKLVFIPKEIEEQGGAATIAYMAGLPHAKKPLNRVRAIFIGYGAAGKSSLIRALNGESVVEGKEAMTPGVDIRSWPVEGTEIKAHFWDFGGQVMSHATHQFFLRSSCLYVVVLDARSEINANEQAEYWLEHIKAFGAGSPVMLVGNKSELAPVNLDMNYLKGKHPNIIGFYPLSCTEYKGSYRSQFDSFQKDFRQQLQTVGTHQMMFTDEQFKVLEALRERSPQKAFLENKEFEDICDKAGINTKGSQDRKWLLDILDKLGVVIHFPEISYLDSYVLNPRWLTYGVYTLLYSEKAKEQKGRLSDKDVEQILREKRVQDELGNRLDYPKDKCGFIVKAMEQFKLCFRLPQKKNVIILPDLLPSEMPKLDFNKGDALAFRFDFQGFLPRHLMPSLIVSRNEEILDNVAWQNGVLLYNKEYKTTALIHVDYHLRKLFLWAQGKSASRYFTILRDEIVKILKRMPQLEYEEKVRLPEDARIGGAMQAGSGSKENWAGFHDLLALEMDGETLYRCAGGKYNLPTVLKIMPSDKREEVVKNYNFHGPTTFVEKGEAKVHIGDVNIHLELKSAVTELDTKLADLIRDIKKAKCDEEEERDIALLELRELRESMEGVDKATKEEKEEAVGSLKRFGVGLKDGSARAYNFLKEMKNADDLILFLMKRSDTIAELLSQLL